MMSMKTMGEIAAAMGAFLILQACGASKPAEDWDAGPDGGCPPPAEPAIDQDTGKVCGEDQHCQFDCIFGLQGMAPYCTRSCMVTACPAGYLCLSHGQEGPICVIGNCQGNGDCPAGYHCLVDDQDYPNTCRHDDVACASDDDCPAETACNQGLCALWCEQDEDCKAGFHCEWRRRCVACSQDAHCENGFGCEDGNCNTACIEDEDCRLGFACGNAACDPIHGGGEGEIDAGCEAHEDCVDFCHDAFCTSICNAPDDTESCPQGYHCHPANLICVAD